VDDADGVDAVLYDTGPVDENSPGIEENLKYLLPLVKSQKEEPLVTLVNGRS